MVSSVAHILAPGGVKFASLDEINNDKLGPAELYGRSKLAIILGIRYLLCDKVIRPNGDNIYALAVHPGTVCTCFVLFCVTFFFFLSWDRTAAVLILTSSFCLGKH